MKDLLEILMGGARQYLPRLAAVVAAPRKNIARLVVEPADPLKDALVFLLLSYAVRIVLQAPMLPPEFDFVTTHGAIVLVGFFGILAFAALLVFALKIVGGAGTFEKTFVAACYILSPVSIWIVFAQLLVFGMLINDTPELANSFLNVTNSAQGQWDAFFSESPAKAISIALLYLSSVAVTIGWFIICWGVFRDMHQLSKLRTVISFLIAAVFFIAVGTIEEFVLEGLFRGNAPRVL